jgi:hypothetical protein
MVELYFLLYRIPKMMTRAAHERGRSALAWSLLGIGVWIGAEVAAAIAIGVLFRIVDLLIDLHDIRPIVSIVRYFLALAAALISVTVLRWRLLSIPHHYSYQVPPPPPAF